MHFLIAFLLLHFLAHLLLLLKYCFKLSGSLQTFLNSPSCIITNNFPLTSLHYRWPWGFIFPSPTFVKNNQIKSKWSISQSLPSLLLFTIVETCNLSFIVYRLCPLHKAAKNNKGKDKYKTCSEVERTSSDTSVKEEQSKKQSKIQIRNSLELEGTSSTCGYPKASDGHHPR